MSTYGLAREIEREREQNTKNGDGGGGNIEQGSTKFCATEVL